jgi:hypothetical protein
MYIKPHHVTKIYELTELHMEWFNMYHPDIKFKYVDLFKHNFNKINYYIQVDKLGEITDEEIDAKIEKMFSVYNSLFYITEMNKEYELI